MTERIDDVVEAVRWWQKTEGTTAVSATLVAETMGLSFYTVRPLLDDAVTRGLLSITEHGNVRRYYLRHGATRS